MSLFRLRSLPQVSETDIPDVDPTLLSNLDSWPHLKELVHCYHGDWVYSEAKYGQFKSIPAPRFEGQVFESEETDAEADCFNSAFGRLRSFSSVDLPYCSWSVNDGRSPQQLGGSLLQAYDPVFSWELERTGVPGQRSPCPLGSVAPGTSSSTRFSVQVVSLTPQAGLIEPIHGTIALYHRDRREKLSEDVHFHFYPPGYPGAESNGLQGSRRAIFSVDTPSAAVCLLVQLEHPVTEENGVKASVYSRKDPATLTLKEEGRLSQWLQQMPFREPLAFTTIPLFDASITGGLGGFGAAAPAAADGTSSHTNGTREGLSGAEVTAGQPVQVDALSLNAVKECYSEDMLQELKRKSEKPMRAHMQFIMEYLSPSSEGQPPTPTPDTPASEATRYATPTRRVSLDGRRNSSEMRRASIEIQFKPAGLSPASAFNDSDEDSKSAPATSASSPLESLRSSLESRGGLAPVKTKWTGGKDGVVRGGVEVLDFRMTARSEPHTKLMHVLYVYPQSLYVSKKRNVLMKVELKANDLDLTEPGLKSIYPEEASMGMQRHAFSLVAARTKTCLFHDEFKVRLPAVLTPHHHLLFTFYHLDLDPKDRQPIKPQVIGYSVLPLHAGLQVARSDGSLPVAKELLFNYLQDNVKPHMEYWEEGRPLFRLRVRLCSTVYPVNERLRVFFSQYDRQTLEGTSAGTPGLLEAINGLRGVESLPLLQFLQPTLTMLLRMLGGGGETLQVASFRAMVNILTRVQQESSDGADRNRFLVHFVDYAFDDWGGTRQPVYPGLCSVWRSLARSKAKGYRVGPVYDDVLTMAWVFLELIVKSIALEHGPPAKPLPSTPPPEPPSDPSTPVSVADSPVKTEGLSLVTLSTDVFQCIRSLFSCLLTEVLERSTAGGLALARRLNSSLAYFCRDLLTTVDTQQTYELIEMYFERFAGVLEHAQHEMKLAFLKVVSDHEEYLLLPGLAPNESSLLVSTLLREVLLALSHEERDVRTKGARLLTAMLCKHEYDSRYQHATDKLLIAELYAPFVTAVLENVGVFYGLGDVERREVLVSFLSILRELRREQLQAFWQESPEQTRLFFKLLQDALVDFQYVQFLAGSGGGVVSPLPAYQKAPGVASPLSPTPSKGAPFSPHYSEHLSPSIHLFLSQTALNDVKATLESSYTRHSPAERSSLRAQLTQAQQTRKESASKSLRERLNPLVRQQLEVWEGNLSAWVSLHVLENLQAFSDAVLRQPSKVAADLQRLDVICNLLTAFLARPQAVSVWRVLIPTIGLLLLRHAPVFLSPANMGFVKELCFLLLRLLVFRNPRMRRRAAACFLLLFRASFAVWGSIARLRVLLTVTLSELLAEKGLLDKLPPEESARRKGDYSSEAERLRETLVEMSTREGAGVLLAECGLAPVVLSTVRGEANEERWNWGEVALLRSTLVTVVDCSLQHSRQVVRGEGERFPLAESCHALAAAYAHVPDLHIHWLLKLCEHHQELQAWAEAAQTALTIAAVAIQALAAKPGGVWGPEHVTTLQRVCPSLPSPAPDAEAAGVGSSSLSVENGIQYLQLAHGLFVRAELYHACTSLAELLIRAHQARKAYAQLARMHTMLATVYNCIVEQEAAPIPFKDASYYRVGFYGTRFGALHGAQLVYRESREVRLGDMMERCSRSAEVILGGNKAAIQILPDSRDVNPSDLHPEKAYLQITSVEPIPSEEGLDDPAGAAGFSSRGNVGGVSQGPAYMGYSRFMYETPFTEKGPAQGPLEEQWRRRTVLVTEGSFPGLVARLRVVRAWQRDFSPGENAVGIIEQRTAALREEALAVEPRLSTLQRLLQGSVAVQVNGGIVGVCVAFLRPGRVADGTSSAPLPQEDLTRLTDAVVTFMQVCKQAMAVHAQLIGEDDKEFHRQLVHGFEDLQVEVGRYIPAVLTDLIE